MTHSLVREHEHRHAVFVSEVECTDGEIKCLLNRRRREGNDLEITMAAVSGLVYGILSGAGGLTCRRTTAHDVDDHDRGLSLSGVADGFEH